MYLLEGSLAGFFQATPGRNCHLNTNPFIDKNPIEKEYPMRLASGIEKFQTRVYPQMKRDFNELRSGQSPETLFITCSDSRIDPNLVTQTKPGELFVIRNAGNIVPRPGTGELSVEATIQYAVEVLKVKHIVVCGHSHCGAVNGLLNLDSLESLPSVRHWVRKSERVLDRVQDRGEGRFSEAIRENVLLQLEHLMEYPYVATAIEEGRMDLHGWVYHFETGRVEFLDRSVTLA
jgi:carbonic anhydrase